MRTYPPRRTGVAPCAIEGCEQVVFARGWCARHYTRWVRHGDPLGGRLDTLAERFWSKVDRRGPNECWPWLAFTNCDGYGMFRFEGDATMGRAHRAAWRLTYGEIPEGKSILHNCDNPPCCNPRHLRPGTQQENIADMHERGRYVKRGQKATA